MGIMAGSSQQSAEFYGYDLPDQLIAAGLILCENCHAEGQYRPAQVSSE